MRSRNHSNTNNIRYYTYKTDDSNRRTPSPSQRLHYRAIESVLASPYEKDFYNFQNSSNEYSRDKSGTLTSLKIKHKINIKSPIKLIGTLKDLSKSITFKTPANEIRKRTEIACQSDFD
jgi:hypothetical protein